MAYRIFVYGSLKNTKVMSCLLNRPIQDPKPASLRGYRRCPLKGRRHPGTLIDHDHVLEGAYYDDLSFDELRLLDAFESFEYNIEKVTILTSDTESQEAYFWHWKPIYEDMCIDAEWKLEKFTKENLSHYLKKCTAFREYYLNDLDKDW